MEDGTSDAEESGTTDDGEDDDKKPVSAIMASLQLYKEALASEDESKVAEIELFLKSIEDEKIGLEMKVASLSEELSAEKVRILRISADFDNFRKRTDRERISLVTNAQGEVVESLLGVLDNFERAKAQIKVETEGEEKINNSYQSIYKQFGEILSSLGVLPVETVGKPFDPLVSHSDFIVMYRRKTCLNRNAAFLDI
jgi:molecular chaperone GrpE